MQQFQIDFLNKAQAAAGRAGCNFPKMVAAEAALESSYGQSGLAKTDNNLFGMKQHQHPVYGTHNLPTKEFVGVAKEQAMGCKDGKLDGWITVNAPFVSYPDWASCFADRLATLKRLSSVYPHYAAALRAPDPITYINEVSQTWSTDPKRAQKIIFIFNSF